MGGDGAVSHDALRNSVQKVGRSDRQCMGQFYYIQEAYVALATFHTAYVVTMKVGQLR
jgi:hypothetical protein